MTRVVELALERVAELWPQWIRTRHKKRQVLAEVITTNIKIVLSMGNRSSKDYLYSILGNNQGKLLTVRELKLKKRNNKRIQKKAA